MPSRENIFSVKIINNFKGWFQYAFACKTIYHTKVWENKTHMLLDVICPNYLLGMWIHSYPKLNIKDTYSFCKVSPWDNNLLIWKINKRYRFYLLNTFLIWFAELQWAFCFVSPFSPSYISSMCRKCIASVTIASHLCGNTLNVSGVRGTKFIPLKLRHWACA